MEEIAADVIEKVKHLAQQLLEVKKQKLNSQG